MRTLTRPTDVVAFRGSSVMVAAVVALGISLMSSGPGRTFRGVGAAGTLCRRTPCGLQIASGGAMIVGNEGIDQDRRRFLGRMALAIGAAHVGMFGTAELQGASRQLAAIGRASEWLNSPRLTPESLAGKVVLVQFWTYTCINWLRTLPYVRAWAQKYRQKFVVIGVHTPEFAFEHNIDNVRRAVRQMGIEYPVVIDNDYSIWRAFNNRYWPALYFVDARGRIREHHFGEGEYRAVRVRPSTVARRSGCGRPS